MILEGEAMVPANHFEHPSKLCSYCALSFCSFFTLCILTLAGYSWNQGDPERLLHGSDVNGKLCLPPTSFTYYPKPTNSTMVTLCLQGCPLSAALEAICGDNAEFECYHSYPSKPFFNDYCLPAETKSREAVLERLYQTQEVTTRIAGDVYRVHFGGELLLVGLTAGVGLALLLLFLSVLLCSATGRPCPLWCLYYACFLFMFGTMAVLCSRLYLEADRVSERICAEYSTVQMQTCGEDDKSTWYRTLCWVLAAVFVYLALKAGRVAKDKHMGLLAVHVGVQMTVFIRNVWGMAVVAYITGVGIYYLCVNILVYQTSCWSKSIGAADTELHGSVKEHDFYLVTRVLVLLTVLYACFMLSVIVTVVRKATKWAVQKEIGLNDAVYSLKKEVEDALRKTFLQLCLPITRLGNRWQRNVRIAPKGNQSQHLEELRGILQASAVSVMWLFKLVLTLALPTFVGLVCLLGTPPSVTSALVPAVSVLPLSWFLSRILTAPMKEMVSGELKVLGGEVDENEKTTKMMEMIKGCVDKSLWEEHLVLREGEKHRAIPRSEA